MSAAVCQQAMADFVNDPDGLANSCFTGDGVSGGADTKPVLAVEPGILHGVLGHKPFDTMRLRRLRVGDAIFSQHLYEYVTQSGDDQSVFDELNALHDGRIGGRHAAVGQPGHGRNESGMAFDGAPENFTRSYGGRITFLTSSGQVRTFSGVVANSALPLRVTLAWTDAPGATSGNAYNNNLDLTVTAGGNTLQGQMFSGSGAFSTTGGLADVKDNVESVFLPAGVSGTVTVTVTATSINSIGVPNSNNSLSQGILRW